MSDWKVGDSRNIIHTFSNEDVSRFVSLTGDDNKIHVSDDYARKTFAGGVIVHGMLAAAYVSTLIGKEIPGDGAVWSSFDVTWRNPVRIGDTVHFRAEIKDIRPSTGVMTLAIVGENKTRNNTSLEANAKVMVMQSEPSDETKPSMENKRILVTGASGVVGQAIVDQLQKLGARPILWGRNSERLKTVAGSCEWMEVDLSDPEAIDAGIESILTSGAINGLVHLAAPPAVATNVDDTKNVSELISHLQVGPIAYAQLCAKLLPVMPVNSSIVAILTQYVIGTPPAKMSAYISAKMAMLGLVRSIAVEAGPHGIRCNAVSPGMMNTPYSETVPLRLKQIEAATTPLRRLCSPNEVADAVCFLLGPESSFINGTNLPLTGGSAVT